MVDKGIGRRQLLKGLGGFAVGGAIGLANHPARADEPRLAGYTLRPAATNAAETLSGIHVVAQKSVAAGETVDFRVSADAPYRIEVARLGWNTEDPGRDWVVHRTELLPAAPRPVRPGSYVHVERALPSAALLHEITLECWVRRKVGGWQGLITQHDYPSACGVGLFVGEDGRAYAYFGDGRGYRSPWMVSGRSKLPLDRWVHVVATFRNGQVALYVDGLVEASPTLSRSDFVAGSAPLRLGAYGTRGETGSFLHGDLAMPVIYSRALGAWEVFMRSRASTITAPRGADVVGCWPLDEEGGDSVADSSLVRRDGVIVNRGTWMIGGPRFDAARVRRDDTSYDPDLDPKRGHALRLSPDDLYEVDWPISARYTIPDDLPSGLFVARIDRSGQDPYHATFVVRASAARPRARILVLCATNTWHAYNDQPFSGATTAAAYSFYRTHLPAASPNPSGIPAYQLGLDLPWPSAGPYDQRYTGRGYSHLVRAERFLHVWLEKNGYDFDLASDADLDADPTLLDAYPVVMIAGHSEYWSRRAYDAVQSWVDSGGQLVVASGNTMFWRVSIEDGVIECRKLPNTVGGQAIHGVGELYHTHDHARGGLAREAGMPAWQATGLECIAYDGDPAPFEVYDATHPFYTTPELVPVSDGDPLGGLLAVDHEYDVTLGQIANAPPATAGYAPTVIAQGITNSNRFDYAASWQGWANDVVVAEIIDWPRQNGGRVFSAGSIATASALHQDENLSTVFRNALDQMGVVFRRNLLALGAGGELVNKWHTGRAWGPGVGSWQTLGTGFAGAPTGVMWAPNRLAIMAISTSGTLRYAHWNGSSWSGWSDFGGSFQGRPAAVAWGRNRLEIFCRGRDGRLYQKSWTGAHWEAWRDLGGTLASDPTAIVREGDHLAVAALGTNGGVHYKWWSADGGWGPSASGWQDFGGSFAVAPTLVAWGGNRIDLLAADGAGHVQVKWWDGSSWSTGWQDLGGPIVSRVAVGVRAGESLSVFGIDPAGRMRLKWWDGASWSTGWQDLGGCFVGAPSVATHRGGSLTLAATGEDALVYAREWDGTTWSGWQSMGGPVAPNPCVFSWIATGPLAMP
ncbi:MAG: LamG domain-containing protein [Myxococcales bacterium]|nr:LamG domain-containing protein [Myxococcales bacterium]